MFSQGLSTSPGTKNDCWIPVIGPSVYWHSCDIQWPTKDASQVDDMVVLFSGIKFGTDPIFWHVYNVLHW